MGGPRYVYKKRDEQDEAAAAVAVAAEEEAAGEEGEETQQGPRRNIPWNRRSRWTIIPCGPLQEQRARSSSRRRRDRKTEKQNDNALKLVIGGQRPQSLRGSRV
ncbi:hypothetical protein TESG_08350 [Trichophyton tonsurans CBS 112818]|uniref:Uncharacterized protein n=1 Tax=Trichophyton tonsurans (strain CBS 112818) TaxID=647933 RepID=F2RU10_TRIT1|nr:hypothetical protein TESG_08350 [Trichophyton tonsurans CBS 112818]